MSAKTEIDFQKNPVTYNELYQIQSGYPGLDILETSEIKKKTRYLI